MGQQYEESLEKQESTGDNVAVDGNKGLNSSITVKKGILKDFEIWPLYAAMPPEEQVREVGSRIFLSNFIICDLCLQCSVLCVVTSYIRIARKYPFVTRGTERHLHEWDTAKATPIYF